MKLKCDLLQIVVLTFLISSLVLTADGCVRQGPLVTILGVPHLVSQSQPESAEEKGIGQDPKTDGMFVQWHSVPGAAGYDVFRSDSTHLNGIPFSFSIVASLVPSSTLNDTSTVDKTVSAGIRYYYYVRAYTSDGVLSPPSDTTNYELLNRCGVSQPTPGSSVDSSGLFFQWYNYVSGGYNILRLKDVSVIPAVDIWITRRFPALEYVSRRVFNFDSTAIAALVVGHTYQWRVDVFNVDKAGRPSEGSRSQWWTFTVKR